VKFFRIKVVKIAGLSIELSTVKFHIGNILRKFNVKRRKEVAEIIREMGLADLFE
jgi:DNA-binding CsgD family transcriptional regulator